MKYVLKIILDTHLLMLLIVLISYIIEKITWFKLLIFDFTWKKSEYMATGSANLISIMYFILSLIVLLFNVYILRNSPEDYRFWKWLIIMFPLSIIVRFLYYHLQAKDKTKKGFHID